MKKQLFFLVILTVGFIQNNEAQAPSYVPTNGLVAYWGFSGNANDSSGNAHNGTVNGATLTNDRFGNASSAYSFNGSTSYISVPHNAAFNMQQATWNVWVYKTSSTSGNGMYLFGKDDSQHHHITILGDGAVQIGWAASQASGIAGSNIVGGWHMITVTYNQSVSMNNFNCYIDGVLTGVSTAQPFAFNGGDIRFGKSVGSYWQLLDGLIDDASVYNRILTQPEIQQLYAGPTTVANCPTLTGTLTNGLVAYYPFCGNANDASGSNNNGTVNGATLSTDRFGNANSAYSFNGVNNYIRCINAGVTGNNSRSVAFWVKTNSTTPGSVLSYGNSDTPYQDFRIIVNGLGISCGGANTDMSTTITGSGRGVQYAPNNTWDFFTFVYDKTLSTNLSNVKVYKNGILATSYCDENITNALNTGSSNPLTIGCYHWLAYSGNKQYFNGILDDIALWNRALTADEAMGLFNTQENTCETLVINSGPLGFNPPTYASTVTIYPNPAQDQITIDCGNLATVSGWTIKIINSLGQEVFNGAMNTQQYTINLNGWGGTGLYFVKIYNESNVLMNTKKILLQ